VKFILGMILGMVSIFTFMWIPYWIITGKNLLKVMLD